MPGVSKSTSRGLVDYLSKDCRVEWKEDILSDEVNVPLRIIMVETTYHDGGSPYISADNSKTTEPQTVVKHHTPQTVVSYLALEHNNIGDHRQT